MAWSVSLKNKVNRQLKKIDKVDKELRDILFTLIKEIELSGPIRGNWANYSKLSDKRHHCHLKSLFPR